MERREKNIQAGNPFAKFGYKAKVATLSKGKYLEVHDLDSIVKIGSSLWHVKKQKIVSNSCWLTNLSAVKNPFLFFIRLKLNLKN